MRGCSWGPIRPLTAPGSRKRPLIPLDDALSAGGFQIAAELCGLFGRAERPDHGAVVDALVAQISPLDDRWAGTHNARELALERPVGGLGVGLVLLRGDLHQISAAG